MSANKQLEKLFEASQKNDHASIQEILPNLGNGSSISSIATTKDGKVEKKITITAVSEELQMVDTFTAQWEENLPSKTLQPESKAPIKSNQITESQAAFREDITNAAKASVGVGEDRYKSRNQNVKVVVDPKTGELIPEWIYSNRVRNREIMAKYFEPTREMIEKKYGNIEELHKRIKSDPKCAEIMKDLTDAACQAEKALLNLNNDREFSTRDFNENFSKMQELISSANEKLSDSHDSASKKEDKQDAKKEKSEDEEKAGDSEKQKDSKEKTQNETNEDWHSFLKRPQRDLASALAKTKENCLESKSKATKKREKHLAKVDEYKRRLESLKKELVSNDKPAEMIDTERGLSCKEQPSNDKPIKLSKSEAKIESLERKITQSQKKATSARAKEGFWDGKAKAAGTLEKHVNGAGMATSNAGASQLGNVAFKWASGEKVKPEDLTSIPTEAVKSTVKYALQDSAASALKGGVNTFFGTKFKAKEIMQVGNAVYMVGDAYAKGESLNEAAEILVDSGVDMTISIGVSTTVIPLVQAAIPIPVVGAVVGSFVSGFVTSGVIAGKNSLKSWAFGY